MLFFDFDNFRSNHTQVEMRLKRFRSFNAIQSWFAVKLSAEECWIFYFCLLLARVSNTVTLSVDWNVDCAQALIKTWTLETFTRSQRMQRNQNAAFWASRTEKSFIFFYINAPRPITAHKALVSILRIHIFFHGKQ